LNILVTGGAGFIGSNFVKLMLEKTSHKIVNVDSLTYAGNLKNLTDIENNPNYVFLKAQIQDITSINSIIEEQKIEAVINFAAESHVDRSILDSRPFVDTNVMGTLVLLDLAKKHNLKRYLQVSTDEVYGSLGATGLFTEETPLSANSPYSASKASADLLVRAYHHTHGLDTVTTRCSNNYGPYQFPEKLIPLMILNALEGKELPVYGDGKNVRDWLYVQDHCSAIYRVFESGNSGEVYNIGGNCEKQNIEIVKLILGKLGKSEDLIRYVKDRPGHDLRYAIDNSKIKRELGWEPEFVFEEAIAKTIDWYLNNLAWSNEIRSGEYMNYYSTQYKDR
jgi:dTDP-glucose 4,6-dehydratase